jgi:hypothetical protein
MLFCGKCKSTAEYNSEQGWVQCDCGIEFLKAKTEHPWDKRWGHVYIGLRQYKDIYV